MSESTVKIEGLNETNWHTCCELEVAEEQKQYMVLNAVPIAQSKFEPTLKAFAIYAEERIVGFLMCNTVPEELDAYWIYRIMVDKRHQGNSIGKEATRLMIKEMVKSVHVKKMAVGYHPENYGAHHLYASSGFVDNGDRFGKEMAVVKSIKS